MKWRSKIVLIALAILATGLAWWLYSRESEPTYKGRKLSEWVISEWTRQTSMIPKEESEEAIARIGTNALPFLVKWIAYVAPRSEPRLFGMPIPLVTRDKKTELAQATFIAFRILGPRAAPAIPDLVHLLKGTNALVASRALSSIDEMGIAGVPALLDFVTNWHAYAWSQQLRPINVMSNLGTNGAVVVPVLTQCLKSPDPQVAGIAALLLANTGKHLGIGTQTNVIVPALVEATVSTNEQVRFYVLYGLGKLGTSAQSAVPALERALVDPDAQVRNQATNSLRKIAPSILGEKDQERSSR